MGTYHSFVSQPLPTKKDAEYFLTAIKKVMVAADDFSIIENHGFFLVVGVYKNLGGIPTEFLRLNGKEYWATVSDEGDFLNSGA